MAAWGSERLGPPAVGGGGAWERWFGRVGVGLVVALALAATSCADSPGTDADGDASVADGDGDADGDASAGDAAIAPDDSDGNGDGAAAVSTAPLVPPPGGYAAIFLDVGQGDATLLIAADGETALIDGGVSGELLRKRLGRLGVSRIDTVVATHADADHITGLAVALEDFAVKRVIWNGVGKDTGVFDAFFAAVGAEAGVEVIIGERGAVLPFGPLKFEVLHPTAGAKADGDHNNQSVVLQTGCAGGWLLMPGDAEAPAEASMLAASQVSEVDILHVGHHGSSSSTSAAFLQALAPAVAIISAGAQNAYGHPDADVVERLQAAGAVIWRTDIGWEDESLAMHADCKGGIVFSRVP